MESPQVKRSQGNSQSERSRAGDSGIDSGCIKDVAQGLLAITNAEVCTERTYLERPNRDSLVPGTLARLVP